MVPPLMIMARSGKRKEIITTTEAEGEADLEDEDVEEAVVATTEVVDVVDMAMITVMAAGGTIMKIRANTLKNQRTTTLQAVDVAGEEGAEDRDHSVVAAVGVVDSKMKSGGGALEA